MTAVSHASAWLLRGATFALFGPCLAPPTSLGPTRLTSVRAPREIIKTATHVLEAADFVVSASDAAAGTLLATRVRSPDQQGGDVVCSFPRGSADARGGVATMTMRVTARPARRGSEIVLTALVRTVFPQLANFESRPRTSETECITTGAIEKRIADALQH